MAAISLSDCKIYKRTEGDVESYFIQTPATADSADTVDITAIRSGRNYLNVEGFDATTGDNVTATVVPATDVVTLDAAGGTTNHVYVVQANFVR